MIVECSIIISSCLLVIGSGKTAIMREKLRAMDTGAMGYTTINLNSYSDAPSLQPILEQPLEKKSGAACDIC